MKCEVCGMKAHHEHHIVSKSFHGSNKPHNLAQLCASCHAEVHLGNIIIEGKFLTSDGFMLIWHQKGADSITGVEPDVYLVP